MKEELQIPEDVEVKLQEHTLQLEKQGKKLEVQIPKQVEIKLKDKKIDLSIEKPKKKQRGLLGTAKSKIKIALRGLEEDYEYNLVVIYRHFPMNLKIKGSKIEINNFTGEKNPRYAKIVGDTKVEIKGEEITVKGPNKEQTGQTAANLEQATLIRGKDPRKFEDGIYITKKPSK